MIRPKQDKFLQNKNISMSKEMKFRRIQNKISIETCLISRSLTCLHMRKETKRFQHPFLKNNKSLLPLLLTNPCCSPDIFLDFGICQYKRVTLRIKQQSHSQQPFVRSENKQIILQTDFLDESTKK